LQICNFGAFITAHGNPSFFSEVLLLLLSLKTAAPVRIRPRSSSFSITFQQPLSHEIHFYSSPRNSHHTSTRRFTEVDREKIPKTRSHSLETHPDRQTDAPEIGGAHEIEINPSKSPEYRTGTMGLQSFHGPPLRSGRHRQGKVCGPSYGRWPTQVPLTLT
jgi:hypothetical protein